MMKILVLLSVLLFCSLGVTAQRTPNQERLSEIQLEIDEAVKEQDFLKAAGLARERDIRKEIEKAIKEEDFLKAADLTEQLKSNSGVPNSELEEKLQDALAKEDYRLAQQIQNEIDGIDTGAPYTAKRQVDSPQVVIEDDYYYPTTETGQPLHLELPEFYDQVYNRELNGSLRSLEKVNGQLKSSGGGYGGFSGRRTSFVLAGRHSRIVLTKQDLSFVIRVDFGVDPSDVIQLIKLDIKGNNRYAHISEGRTFVYAGSSNQVTSNQREISFESMGNGVFKIIIHSELDSGQYAFKNENKFYAFTLR